MNASGQSHPSTTIVWFRNDLRTDDHEPLLHASERGVVVPVFIMDPSESTDSTPGGASRWWLSGSLVSLAQSLADLGSPMVLRRGDPATELRRISEETGARRVSFHESIEPDAQRRDDWVENALVADGIEVARSPMNLLWVIGSVLTQGAKPYQVFTPFWKRGLQVGEIDPAIDRPKRLQPPSARVESMSIDELLPAPSPDWASGMRDRWTPGEPGASAVFETFLRERINHYKSGRDRLDISWWSALSPHLHFGELSVRRLWRAITRDPDWSSDPNAEHFLREVGWREFAQHLLNHFPHTVSAPLRDQFERFPWRDDPEALERWQRGMTGYPVVDAAMRNLWHEGWMPNRARMIVASFLCKDLLISWEHGARWFWDTLVDADLASNTLGWQWTAGCGADAAPYFRVFNPVSQGEKFDPDGAYVRRWVPELSGLATTVIHRPWEASPMELLASGVELGETYPHRIVDHARARLAALDAYQKIKR